MNIHIISSLFDGGAQKVLYKILINSKNRNIIITLRPGGKYFSLLNELPNVSCIYFLNIKYLIILLNQSKNKINIIGWMYHAMLFACIIKLFKKKSSLFWNVRQSIEDISQFKFSTLWIVKILIFLSFLFRPKIIYCGYKPKEEHEKLGFNSKYSYVIYNGFEKQKFFSNKNSKSKIRFVCASRFVRQKNIPLMLSGLKALKNIGVNFSCDFYGEGFNYKNMELIFLIKKNKLIKFINLRGSENDIKKIFSNYDFSLQTSNMEGFSNSLGESMSFGTPVICSDVGENLKLVGETGYVFEKKSKSSYFKNLKKATNLYLNDYEKYLLLRKKTYERLNKNFNISRMTKKYSKLIN